MPDRPIIMSGDAKIYDKNSREIVRGDVLKVFHFIGARKKRHYMYKQALEVIPLGYPEPKPYLKISHLNLSDDYYVVIMDGSTLEDYEIIQSIDAMREAA